MQVFELRPVALAEINISTGAIRQVDANAPYTLHAGKGAAVIEYLATNAEAFAMLVLKSTSGTIVLRPGDMVPLALRGEEADWQVYTGSYGGDRPLYSGVATVVMWSAEEAALRAGMARAPLREQRYYGPGVTGINDSTLAATRTSNALLVSGFRDVTAYVQHTRLTSPTATRIDVELEVGTALGWFNEPTESIAGAVGTLSTPYVKQHAVTGAENWVCRWQINDMLARLVVSSPDGGADDVVEISVLLGA